MDPLQVGDSHPVVATACRKLGVFPMQVVFTETLAQRIRGYQHIHGLDEDGLLDEPILNHLGIEIED